MTLTDGLGITSVIFDVSACRNQKMGIFEMNKLKPGIYFLRIVHRNGEKYVWPVIKE